MPGPGARRDALQCVDDTNPFARRRRGASSTPVSEPTAGPDGPREHAAYEARDEDFIRYRDCAYDDEVRSMVRARSFEGHDRRDALARDVVDALRLFGMRRTLHAHRLASTAAAGDALSAFALMPRAEDVPWDSWLKAALVVVRETGGDVDAAAACFTDLASPPALERFAVARESLARITSFAQCRLEEVRTTYGAGFVETLVFRDKAPPGWLGTAPRLGDHLVPYRPTTNLAQLAVSFADAVDDHGSYVTGALAPDQVAALTFGLTVAGSYLPTTGCLSFVADASDDEPSISAFVAELADGYDVDDLLDATSPDQALAHDGRRVIVIMRQPDFRDEPADDADLAPLLALAQDALRANAPLWSP